jgi:hypothetical protein
MASVDDIRSTSYKPIFRILQAIQNEDANCQRITKQTKLDEFGFNLSEL